MLDFCRDCANLEDRRDIDSVAMCGKNHGPYITCEDFELKDAHKNEGRLYYNYCPECVNFEDINDTPICAKNHTPGVACDDFSDNFLEKSGVKQNNLMKTTLLVHSMFFSNSLPDYLKEIGRKIKW